MELMTTMAEQNNPFQKFNVVLSDKITLAVQDITNLESDAGVTEGSNVLAGNSSSAASEHAQENGVDDNSRTACPPECTAIFDSQHIHHVHLPQSQSNAFYNQTGDMQVIAAVPVYVYLDDTIDTRKKRSKKEVKARPVPSRQVSKSPRKKRTGEGEDLSKQEAKALSEWTGQAVAKGGEELNNGSSVKFEWKNRDVGLNEVTFDEATMPAPVCSCTGTAQRCYRWGNGGWQSSCCTPTLSMYPLPFLPIKRHGRVSGRKMSGGAFTKLLSRMAAEGHDLFTPLDLKDHWAKHGTNGWITIK